MDWASAAISTYAAYQQERQPRPFRAEMVQASEGIVDLPGHWDDQLWVHSYGWVATNAVLLRRDVDLRTCPHCWPRIAAAMLANGQKESTTGE